MQLEDLLAIGFSDGAGKSRKAALHSDRYSELVNNFPRIPYLTAEKTAEMVLLGEQLADRAFLNMPIQLRRVAATWPNLDEQAQEGVLSDLYRILGEESLERRKSSRDDINNDDRVYMPNQYKSWSRRIVQPNCLGLSQMLIGFARATGAPFMLVNRLQDGPSGLFEARYIRFLRLISIIEPYAEAHPRFNYPLRVLKSACDDLLTALATRNKSPAGHSALVIRTASNWKVIDPYLEVFTTQGETPAHLDQVYTQSNKTPYETVAEKRPPMALDVSSERILDALSTYITYLDRLHEDLWSWNYIEITNQCVAEMYGYSPYVDIAKDFDEEQYSNLVSLIERGACSRRTTAAIKKGGNSDELRYELLLENVEKAATNKRMRNQSFVRFIDAFIRACYVEIWPAENPDNEHHIQEYSHPTLYLGIRTVNRIAARRHVDVPELLLYSSGQWVLHDSLAVIHRSGDKLLAKVLAQRIEEFCRQPSAALPALWHLLWKEENHA